MLTEAAGLLDRLRSLGAQVTVVGDSLQVSAPEGVLTDELKQQLVELKPEVLSLVADAVRRLNHWGVRLIIRQNRIAVGMWRDADQPDVRDALRIVGLGDTDVSYLDDPEADIPDRYRQSAPACVTEIWARQGLPVTPAEKWEAETKARNINRVFDTVGTARGRSRITPATVWHGMLAARNKPSPRR